MTSADPPRPAPGGVHEVASGVTLPRLAAVAGPLGVVIFFVELALGVTLVLLGLATCWTASCPTWLGLVAIATGIGWSVLAVLLASRGFDVSVSTPAMAVTYLTGIWVMAEAVRLWRRTGRQSGPRRR